MSDAVASTQRDPSEPVAAHGHGHRRSWLTPANVVVAITIVAFGLRLYRVLRPGLFNVTQYDDGPYFGSAVMLVHGIVPYRDFALVQPPGITVLMSPVALLTRIIGTDWGMAIGRILTVLAGAAGVPLAALLVRHRGLGTVSVTAAVMAVYPDSVAAAHTILLEPWLVLFCLLGALAVFDGDGLNSSYRRLAWGGVAFGFAGAVKSWAIVPVIVIFALLLPRPRRAAVFTGGVAAGFFVPVLPFLAVAPRRMFESVVADQLARVGTRVRSTQRLIDMIGINSLPPKSPTTIFAVAAAIVVVIVIANAIAARVYGRPLSALDWFAAATAPLVLAMFLWPPYFASHYAAFLTPFLALAVALPLSRLAAGDAGAQSRPSAGAIGAARPTAARPTAARPAWWLALALAVALIVGALVPFPVDFHLPRGAAPSLEVQRIIPAGACVLSDQVSYLLLANRLVSTVPGCPVVLDSLGADLSLSNGLAPATGARQVPAVDTFWRQAFGRAQYLLLSAKYSTRIPWTSALSSYFHHNFTLVMAGRGYNVYARKGVRVRVHHHRHRRTGAKR